MDDQKLHTLRLVTLPAAPERTPHLPRRAMPVAPIYPMERLAPEARIAETPPPMAVPRRTVSKTSIFFKVVRKDPEKDPFLQRLSRLN